MNVSSFTNDHLKNMHNAIDYDNKGTLLTGDYNVNLINYDKKKHIKFS